MEPRDILVANWSLVERAIDGVIRRARLYGADAADFRGAAYLALVEEDYEILRRYEGRASLATYLTIVAERLLCDMRTHQRGRWHASAEATRMGPAALVLEMLVRRDQRTLDEALPIVRGIDPELTREALESMLASLPERRPRPAAVPIEAVAPERFVAREEADAPLVARELRQLSDRTSAVVRQTLAEFTAEERALLKMRFVAAMSVADISRMTRLPQRPLYRRFQELLGRLRKALRLAGISVHDVSDVLAAAADLDFGLENGDSRQSTL
ncbi:MAG: sigma-70 family RNA polymerase sigma factor, partial [Acidobacteriota bacterium]|nr:sigma-70 family RNA polymerase sigma factor [Acidobacteriota bacterium]